MAHHEGFPGYDWALRVEVEDCSRLPIDCGFTREEWGDGPWTAEPDVVEWRSSGLPCLILRAAQGNLCGYVAVPPGHPCHGQEPFDVPAFTHGGINIASRCEGSRCHVPLPGEPDDVWWFGFDCGHAFDLVPGMEASIRKLIEESALLRITSRHITYRDIEYVRHEVEALAEQLAGMVKTEDVPRVPLE